jgi:serine/threonine-protein kinase
VPLTPGSTFERYEIQSLIGRGGMGEVYRAVDTRLHRPVALKVLRTDADASTTVTEAGGVARLLREARAAAALNHANSVAIYELGEAEGIAYIAMELVIGVTFRKYLGESNVSLDTKVSWLVDAARALWAAHKAGLVHRDVKPGNIMVSEEGVVKVLDFGLAKPVSVNGNPHEFQTLMGQVLGTPRYMAPEQLEGSTPDASADQYAFGLTAYELVTGFYAGGPLAGAVVPVHERCKGPSPDLGGAIARMMARQPRDRFPTMEAAAHALRACIGSQPQQTAGRALPKLDTTVHDVAASARSPSNAPTAIVDMAEPVSAEREVQVRAAATAEQVLAKGATMPLAVPLKVAIGDRVAAQLASGGSAAGGSPEMNRTLPLARPAANPGHAAHPAHPSHPAHPAHPATSGRPPSDPSVPVVPSGVYARDHAEAHARRGALGAGVVSPAEPRASAPRPWLLIAVIVAAAVAGSGIAAWFLR